MLERRLERNLIAGYVPKNDLTGIAIALYGIVTILLWTNYVRHGKHKWMLALTIGATCMTTGFIVRVACHYYPYSLGLYVISTLFILLSPCAFLAADYVALSHISRYLGQDVTKNCLVFPVTALVKFFVISDVTTFAIQAAGGAMTASGQTNPKMGDIGEKVSMAGLSLQGASFISYTFILMIFGFKVRQLYPEKWHMATRHPELQAPRRPFWNILDRTPILDWRICYFGVLATCAGFICRSAFRIAEFSGGYTGYIYTHEGYFYAFDALACFLAISVYVFLWPPRYLKHTEVFTDSSAAMSEAKHRTGSVQSQQGTLVRSDSTPVTVPVKEEV